MASNSARFGCWISKWRLRLYSFGIETALRQPKHSTFEFTTVNKYLFVHFELNTLPLFFYFFSCFQSSWYATQEHNKCLPTNKLKVKMLVKTTHAVDSSGTHIVTYTQLHQLSHHITTNMNCLKEIVCWDHMKSFRGPQ